MEVLGVGSTSTVHRCLNKIDDLFYACKIIDKFQMEDRFAGMMAQFQTEIEALRELQHASIIRLYDVYLTEDKIYIIMEQMEGGELFDYVVQKGTLNEEEASKIVRKVTSAMVYMHSKVRRSWLCPRLSFFCSASFFLRLRCTDQSFFSFFATPEHLILEHCT